MYKMRPFVLARKEDVSGVSGEGIVAEGVEFTDGTCALSWLTKHKSHALYPNIKELESIHGHDGATIIIFVGGVVGGV